MNFPYSSHSEARTYLEMAIVYQETAAHDFAKAAAFREIGMNEGYAQWQEFAEYSYSQARVYAAWYIEYCKYGCRNFERKRYGKS